MKYKFFHNEKHLKFIFQNPETLQEDETFIYYIEGLEDILDSILTRLEEDVPERERSMLEVISQELDKYIYKHMYSGINDETKYEEVK